MARNPVIQVALKPELLAGIDRVRGGHSRCQFVRSLLEVAVVAASPPATAPQAAPSEAIMAAKPLLAREAFELPPVGQADAHGWHYRWEPTSESSGILRMAQAGGDWLAVTLIDVELYNLDEGRSRLYYEGRSEVRVEEGE